jgi:UDP-2,4-diacetamido-2,4,6-trideoxy-beta-L-altropyranose hydrolase
MKIVFRVDASLQIGTGHVMRCLTLAYIFRKNGAKVDFICRKHKGNLINKIHSEGFNVFKLELPVENKVDNRLEAGQKQDAKDCIDVLQCIVADWVIIDHYCLNYLWHRCIRPYCKNIMVIDDLANRKLDCDVLLDQNYCNNFENRYDKLVPKKCKKFLGPKSLILRDEFIKLQGVNKKNQKTIKRVMLFFGGSDNSHETIKVVKIFPFIRDLDLSFDIVLGANNPDIKKIINFCKDIDTVSIHVQIDNMAEIMSMADLVIIAGGSTVWEACCLGIPAYTVVTAENQNSVISYLDRMNIVNNLGVSKNLTSKDMLKAVRYACLHADLFFQMSNNASKIISNCGNSINELAILITHN